MFLKELWYGKKDFAEELKDRIKGKTSINQVNFDSFVPIDSNHKIIQDDQKHDQIYLHDWEKGQIIELKNDNNAVMMSIKPFANTYQRGLFLDGLYVSGEDPSINDKILEMNDTGIKPGETQWILYSEKPLNNQDTGAMFFAKGIQRKKIMATKLLFVDVDKVAFNEEKTTLIKTQLEIANHLIYHGHNFADEVVGIVVDQGDTRLVYYVLTNVRGRPKPNKDPSHDLLEFMSMAKMFVDAAKEIHEAKPEQKNILSYGSTMLKDIVIIDTGAPQEEYKIFPLALNLVRFDKRIERTKETVLTASLKRFCYVLLAYMHNPFDDILGLSYKYDTIMKSVANSGHRFQCSIIILMSCVINFDALREAIHESFIFVRESLIRQKQQDADKTRLEQQEKQLTSRVAALQNQVQTLEQQKEFCKSEATRIQLDLEQRINALSDSVDSLQKELEQRIIAAQVSNDEIVNLKQQKANLEKDKREIEQKLSSEKQFHKLTMNNQYNPAAFLTGALIRGDDVDKILEKVQEQLKAYGLNEDREKHVITIQKMRDSIAEKNTINIIIKICTFLAMGLMLFIVIGALSMLYSAS